jgi:hypothetical protein
LIELLPHAGLAAFVSVLPIAGAILLILVLVTRSYRQVVIAYTRAGGSYVVARSNFGPGRAPRELRADPLRRSADTLSDASADSSRRRCWRRPYGTEVLSAPRSGGSASVAP